MSFLPGLADLVDQVAEWVSSGDLVKDPDRLADLKRTLVKNAGRLENGQFKNVAVVPSAFGGTDAATDLGHHHALAHAVVADTIVGVAADLLGFRDGVEEFERNVDRADGETAADMQRRQQGVEALVAASAYSAGDRHNHASRAQHLGPGADR